MTIAITAWAALVLLFGTVALFAVWSRLPTASRALAATAYVVAAVVALPAVLLPLGNCSPFMPGKGDYQVLGGRIDEPDAIHVMLANGPDAPRCYSLPYTKVRAEALQGAMNEGGKVEAHADSDGGVQFEGEPPVTADADKRQEVPLYGG
jgi:hypothetical protein